MAYLMRDTKVTKPLSKGSVPSSNLLRTYGYLLTSLLTAAAGSLGVLGAG